MKPFDSDYLIPSLVVAPAPSLLALTAGWVRVFFSAAVFTLSWFGVITVAVV